VEGGEVLGERQRGKLMEVEAGERVGPGQTHGDGGRRRASSHRRVPRRWQIRRQGEAPPRAWTCTEEKEMEAWEGGPRLNMLCRRS
jgi:hypothetical protein